MARDLNKVQVIGRLGGDPEMRYTGQGSAVTTFSVASGRQWRERDGTQHEETEWFRCVAWEKLAEICNQYLVKGARVYIEGRLKTRKYTDRDGVERFITEVVVSDMIMLDSRRDGQAPPPPADDEIFPEDEPPAPTPAPQPAPARRPAAATPRPGTAPNAPRRNQPQPLGSDDDIPF